MRKNYIVKLLVVLLLFVAAACDNKKTVTATVTETEHEHAADEKYTCPMHPDVVQEGPGKCPICGMDLVPQASGHTEEPIDSALLHLLKSPNVQVADRVPVILPDPGLRIFSIPVQGSINYDQRRQVGIASRVSGRIERLYIKYNYQPVRKGQLIMEVYSPELAAAQRELIYLSRHDNNPDLLQKAKQRLQLLGMQAAQIAQVQRSGQPLYRVPVYSSVSGFIVDESSLKPAPLTSTPMAGSSAAQSDGMGGMGSMGDNNAAVSLPAAAPVNNSPVLIREGQYVSTGQTVFTVYQAGSMLAEFYFAANMASYIRRGVGVVYHLSGNPDDVFTGRIGLVEPTQRAGSNFISARVYGVNNGLQPGQLVTGRIPLVARGWWLPETAVYTLGHKSIVFKKEDKVFVPKAVPTGLRAQGWVQVLDSVARWQVARNASFLVGSESFIHTADQP